MTAYKCKIDVSGNDGHYDLIISVVTNATWKVLTPEGWCPSSGSWDASDLVGRGGCLCYGGGPLKPQILLLKEFKPFGLETYRVGKVGDGKGCFIQPVMQIADKNFDWEIIQIDNNLSLFEDPGISTDDQ